MKVVLDLDRLLRDGRITAEEHDRLRALASEETTSLAFSLFVGVGVICTAIGGLLLAPSENTAIALGAVLVGAGVTLSIRYRRAWGLLGSILMLVGALFVAGGLLKLTDASPAGFLVVTSLLAALAIVARSGLLAGLAVLALSATLGSTTGYSHASYMIAIDQPTLTIGLFAALALACSFLSRRVTPDYGRVLLIAARTSVLLVNFAFLVGSLWGDTLRFDRGQDASRSPLIPDWAFVIAWAVALLVTGIWAAAANRRWVVNAVAVFGAIHLYTQLFERIGANAFSLLIAGVLALLIALSLVRYNRAASVRAVR